MLLAGFACAVAFWTVPVPALYTSFDAAWLTAAVHCIMWHTELMPLWALRR